jgi:predicted alpha/beta-hydrolase family hydrolase
MFGTLRMVAVDFVLTDLVRQSAVLCYGLPSPRARGGTMKTPATVRSRRPLFLLAAVLLVALLLSFALMGCGSGRSVGTTATSASDKADAPIYTEVRFATEDGLTLSGRLYGTGSSAVLLSHMYPADQTSWDAQALRLAGEGYSVFTFDFRGYGESQGPKDIKYLDRDVSAAVMHLRSAGATEVVLVGASMGGTACLKAAAQLQTLSSIRVAGVATFSAPVEFMGLSAREAVPNIVLPMLFVAAEGDVGAEGARELQQLSGGRGDLQILPGSDHGTDFFSGPRATDAWRLLLGFVQQNLGP